MKCLVEARFPVDSKLTSIGGAQAQWRVVVCISCSNFESMEASTENVALLRGLFANTLAIDNQARKAAEQQLSSNFMSMQPVTGFPKVLLMLISQLSGPQASPEDVAIRQSASIFFKNFVKKRWELSKGVNAAGQEELFYPNQNDLEEDEVMPIGAEDREVVKSTLVELLCTTPVEVQKQLAEGMTIVAAQDFPHHWPTLLPQLVEKLKTSDFFVIKGVMLTANSIMKRFRHVYKTDALYAELIVCLQGFQEPLLRTFEATVAAVGSCGDKKESLRVLLDTLRLMARIFFSLNWQDLPEYFEDNMRLWMGEFAKLLEYANPLMVDRDEESEPGPTESLQTAIIENVELYVMKYEDEFKDYLPTFTQLVWKLLLDVQMQPKYDNLATSSIKFLTSVSSKRLNAALFTDQVLQEVIQHIVVKNLTAREADEELFEDNPTDYIRKDMEGSDQDTRRRCAIELVRSLLRYFGPKVSELCTAYIGGMLEEYSKTLDWHAKDSALHLFLACAVTNVSATELNPMIKVQDIFTSHILPEIQDPTDVNSRPIVKAGAIKLVCIFRTHLPLEFLLQILPYVINHLKSSAVVIQTYAAMCIERFLMIKDKVPAAAGIGNGDSAAAQVSVSRIKKEHIVGHAQAMMAELFVVLENPELPENDYVMKCIMRLLVVLGSEIVPLTELVLSKLTVIFERVAKKPVNPHYNHYLFECYAVFIKSCCLDSTGGPEVVSGACDKFEAMLFPPFQIVLSEDVEEFTPYVFQLLAQLLSYRPGQGLSQPYQVLFPPILSPELWERKGNVPALTDLLIAYIKRGAEYVVSTNSLQGVLGVFQKLLSSRSSDQYASKVIDAVFLHVPQNDISQYIPTILNLLLRCLQDTMKNSRVGAAAKTGCTRRFFHSMCVYSSVFGGKAMIDFGLENIERGLISTLAAQVLEPQSKTFAAQCSGVELRRMIVGGSRMLSESEVISNSPELWGKLACILLKIAGQCDKKSMGAAAQAGTSVLSMIESEHDAAESREFDSTYSRLTNSIIPGHEPTPEMQQGAAFFITSLQGMCQSRPGTYLNLLQSILSPEDGQILQQLLQKQGVQLV